MQTANTLLTARIASLEAVARELQEPSPMRRAWSEAVMELAHDVVDGLETRKAWDASGGVRDALLALGVPEAPTELARVLTIVRDEIDGAGLQPASGGHL